MSKHTPEPWEINGGSFIFKTVKNRMRIIARTTLDPLDTNDNRKGDAARIVACVNALAGKDPAVVEEMVGFVKLAFETTRDKDSLSKLDVWTICDKALVILERMEG